MRMRTLIVPAFAAALLIGAPALAQQDAGPGPGAGSGAAGQRGPAGAGSADRMNSGGNGMSGAMRNDMRGGNMGAMGSGSRTAPGGEALVLSKHLKTGYVGTVVATSQPGQATQADFAVIQVDLPAGAVRPLPVAAEPSALSEVVAAGYPAIAIAQDRNLRRLAAGDLKASPQVVLTKGTVSAVQNKERNAPIVLHSADISAGNSGGPLVDACGRAVGINTFIATNQQATKANYALGGSWLAAFLRAANKPVDWRADACL